MTQDNTARRPQDSAAARSGIHLVHSKSWPVAVQALPAKKPVQSVRDSDTAETLSLASGAAVAPLVWVGHALLRLMHLL
jgi:hypothetical protein